MAIDNIEKRRSAGGVGFWVVGPGVTPNINKDIEWRVQSGWGYSGLTAFSVALVRHIYRRHTHLRARKRRFT